MAVTANDLIEATRALLFSGVEPELNRLNGAIDNSQTSITFKYALGSISPGSVISIDLEDIRIWEVAGTQATVVERAVNGTVPAAHTDLTTVEVRPKWSKFRVLRALNEDLADISSPANGLFQVKTLDITYNPARQAYDLTGVTDFINILELRWKQPGPTRHWPLIRKYDVFRNMATTEFSSSLALTLYENAFPGLPIHVRYAAPFTEFVALTDDAQTDAGLPDLCNDIPPLGAAIKLVAPREINRNFFEAQANPRRAEEVPPGAVMQSTRELQRIRMMRITDEAERLANNWPVFR